MVLVPLTCCGSFAGENLNFDGVGRQSLRAAPSPPAEGQVKPKVNMLEGLGGTFGMRILRGCAEGMGEMLVSTYEDVLLLCEQTTLIVNKVLQALRYYFLHVPILHPVRRLLRIGSGGALVPPAGSSQSTCAEEGRKTRRRDGARWHAVRWTTSTGIEEGEEVSAHVLPATRHHVSWRRRWILEGKGMLYALFLQLRCITAAYKFSMDVILFLLFGGKAFPTFGGGLHDGLAPFAHHGEQEASDDGELAGAEEDSEEENIRGCRCFLLLTFSLLVCRRFFTTVVTGLNTCPPLPLPPPLPYDAPDIVS